ncbi:MAG: hypothetical protein Greene041679_621 [Parcubacteria group bacterium Greene0416_79]|nr:MAG: hypothetical protein Greene041679_621 [Parcubacteria group bacterium Greene0416_79]
MPTRKVELANNNFYHVFNRGTDKRAIVMSPDDVDRFFESIALFNSLSPIGSIFEHRFQKEQSTPPKLVRIVAYCLNPNHFHLILEQVADKGIEKFLQRVGNGYTKYFNKKYKRSGVLFQGPFKAVHLRTDWELVDTSVYVNLNAKRHQLGHRMSKLSQSSWNEYTKPSRSQGKVLCHTEPALAHFSSPQEYKTYALRELPRIIAEKEAIKEIYKLQ